MLFVADLKSPCPDFGFKAKDDEHCIRVGEARLMIIPGASMALFDGVNPEDIL